MIMPSLNVVFELTWWNTRWESSVVGGTVKCIAGQRGDARCCDGVESCWCCWSYGLFKIFRLVGLLVLGIEVCILWCLLELLLIGILVVVGLSNPAGSVLLVVLLLLGSAMLLLLSLRFGFGAVKCCSWSDCQTSWSWWLKEPAQAWSSPWQPSQLCLLMSVGLLSKCLNQPAASVWIDMFVPCLNPFSSKVMFI